MVFRYHFLVTGDFYQPSLPVIDSLLGEKIRQDLAINRNQLGHDTRHKEAKRIQTGFVFPLTSILRTVAN